MFSLSKLKLPLFISLKRDCMYMCIFIYPSLFLFKQPCMQIPPSLYLNQKNSFFFRHAFLLPHASLSLTTSSFSLSHFACMMHVSYMHTPISTLSLSKKHSLSLFSSVNNKGNFFNNKKIILLIIVIILIMTYEYKLYIYNYFYYLSQEQEYNK